MEHATVTRYCVPLREGGSLPGVVEADDLGTYVCKFAHAGQGPRVLVAEVIVSGLASLLGLNTPRIVLLELPDELARFEADEEVQDLLRASVGANLGVDYLPGSFGHDQRHQVSRATGAAVLWLDAFTTNVDRTWRNPNLLWWHDDLWLIDHGASLYAHHGWENRIPAPDRFAASAWTSEGHVFAEHAPGLSEVHQRARRILTREALIEVTQQIPDVWLAPVPDAVTAQEQREVYVAMLAARLARDEWLPLAAS